MEIKLTEVYEKVGKLKELTNVKWGTPHLTVEGAGKEFFFCQK